MCRSGNEGPNVQARRCKGKRTHGTPAVARGLPVDFSSLNTNITSDLGNRVQQLQSLDRMVDYDCQSSDLILRDLVQNTSLPGTSTVLFRTHNTVEVLTIPVGGIPSPAYFKPIRNTEKWNYSTSIPVSDMSQALNEVIAFQVGQAMGEEFSNFVPPTVIRSQGTLIGTCQLGVPGVMFESVFNPKSRPPSFVSNLNLAPEDSRMGLLREKLGADTFRKLVILDSLLSTSDRHGENLIVDDRGGVIQVHLIDNGFAKTHDRQTSFMYDLSKDPLTPSEAVLSDSEIAALKNLETSLSEGDYLIPAGRKGNVLKRAQAMLESGTLIPEENTHYF